MSKKLPKRRAPLAAVKRPDVRVKTLELDREKMVLRFLLRALPDTRVRFI